MILAFLKAQSKF